MARYKITIAKRGLIPGIGKGPVLKPITVNETVYNNLIGLGFPVKLISKTGDIAKLNITDTSITDKKINDALNKFNETKAKKEASKSDIEKKVTTKQPKHSSLVKEVKVVETVIDENDTIPEENDIIETTDDVISTEEDSIVETDEDDTIIENDEEEIISTEEKQSEVSDNINDKYFSASSVYTEDFLTSKNICKKILKNRKINFESSNTLGDLKKLVLDSNK